MTDQGGNGKAGTNSAPIFVQNANDLINRLAPQASHPLVARMLAEAEALKKDFAHWEEERPSNEVRIAGIQKLMNLNRRSMDLLTNKEGSGAVQPSAAQQPPPRGCPRRRRRLPTAAARRLREFGWA